MSFSRNLFRLLLRWAVIAIVLLVLAWAIPQAIEFAKPQYSDPIHEMATD
jgi:hypothetical protein